MLLAKQKKLGGKQAVLLVLMCWLAYFFSYVSRLDFSATMAEMTSCGVLLKSEAGAITTVYFLTYGFGQFLSGWLCDRTKPRLLIFAGLLGTGACNMAMALSLPSWLMAVIWGINGLALSLLWAPIVRLVADRIHSSQRGKACTALATTMAAGTLVAYLLSAFMINLFGWSAPFFAAAVLTLLMSVVWIITVTRLEINADASGQLDEAENAPDIDSESVPHTAVPKKLYKLFLVSGLIPFAFACGVHGVLKDCVSTWVPTLLTDSFNMSSVNSILIGTLLPVFALAGPYLTNYIFKKKMQNETGTLVFLFAIATLAGAILVFFGFIHEAVAVTMLSIIYMVSIGMNMMLIGFIPMYFCNVGRVGIVTGILNAVSCFFAAFVSLLVGILTDGGDWSITLILWLILSILGGVACILAGRRWIKFRRNLF